MGGGGGKGGSSGGSTTTVQKADPWAGQQPYLTDVMNQTQGMYYNGQLAPSYYPGQTVAGQSGWTQQALQMQADRALNGSASINTAQNAMDNITNGSSLAGNQGLNTLNELSNNDNPYADALYQRANNQVQSSLDSNFNRAGRYGSGAHEAASADAANNLANSMYGALWDKRADAAKSAGTLYNQGVGQQVLGASTAQNLANQQYTDAAALSEAGGVRDDYNQQLINANIDRYNYDQQRPLMALSNYNQLIQGNYGGTSTSTGQVSGASGNRLGNVVGGALSGGALGYSLASTGYGLPAALGGAALGGLLGLF